MRKVLKLTDNAGKVVDLSEYVVDARLTTTESAVGLKSGELYVIFRPSTTVTLCLDDAYKSDQPATYEYGPAGDAKGQPMYSGQCLLERFTPNEAHFTQTGDQRTGTY